MYMVKVMRNGRKVVNNYQPTMIGVANTMLNGSVFANLYKKVVLTNAL